ncbi:MAG: endonuclease/exonuclease/phosphatase family protein [Deltaproteobacteria bacterium]|nr:endonuclease/exonuclease/phosphatase family protein [Deltaproteobacteria bacterium]
MDSGRTFRLMTYNIRKGLGPDGKSVLTVPLADALKAQPLDFLLCQEVFHGVDDDGQSHVISDALGLTAVYRANKHRRVGHHGNASFTHMPIEHVQNFDISTNPIERRGALYTRVLMNDRRLHLFNVHLGLTERQRLTQMRHILALMQRLSTPDDPVLIAGDFNDWNHNVDRFVCSEMGLVNAFGEPKKATRTWHTKRPMFNLDRIYTKNLTIADARCMQGTPWIDLSDHLPLYVELALTAPAR